MKKILTTSIITMLLMTLALPFTINAEGKKVVEAGKFQFMVQEQMIEVTYQ